MNNCSTFINLISFHLSRNPKSDYHSSTSENRVQSQNLPSSSTTTDTYQQPSSTHRYHESTSGNPVIHPNSSKQPGTTPVISGSGKTYPDSSNNAPYHSTYGTRPHLMDHSFQTNADYSVVNQDINETGYASTSSGRDINETGYVSTSSGRDVNEPAYGSLKTGHRDMNETGYASTSSGRDVNEPSYSSLKSRREMGGTGYGSSTTGRDINEPVYGSFKTARQIPVPENSSGVYQPNGHTINYHQTNHMDHSRTDYTNNYSGMYVCLLTNNIGI